VSADFLTRRRLLAGSAAAAAAAVSGCAADGGGSPRPYAAAGTSAANPFGVDPAAPLEVVVFKGGFGDDYARAFERLYARAYPAARISHLGTQDITGVLQPRFNGGNPPDVVDDSGAQQIKLDVLYGNGQLADLAPLLDAPSVDDPRRRVRDTLLPGTVSQGTYGSSMYVLNYVYTVYGLWYSRRLFRERGWPVPGTWAEFLDLAAEMKRGGIAPLAFQGKYPYYMLVPIMDLAAKNGGPEVQAAIDNLEPGAWKSDAVRHAVEAVHELVARGYTLPGAAGMTHIEAQTAWCHGEAAWIPCGSWLENEQLHVTPAGFGMAVAPMPALPGDRMPPHAVRAGAGEPFVVPARAANVPGGLEFLRLMTSRAGAAAFARTAHSLTVVRDALTPDVPLLPGTASADAAVRAAGSDIITWYFPDWYARMEADLENATGELMAGRMTPDAWIRACQAAADRTARDPSVRRFTRPANPA